MLLSITLLLICSSISFGFFFLIIVFSKIKKYFFYLKVNGKTESTLTENTIENEWNLEDLNDKTQIYRTEMKNDKT